MWKSFLEHGVRQIEACEVWTCGSNAPSGAQLAGCGQGMGHTPTFMRQASCQQVITSGLRQVLATLDDCPVWWSEVPCTGAVPSHRQGLALCGAPGPHLVLQDALRNRSKLQETLIIKVSCHPVTLRQERAVLFGGNTSVRVAGGWQSSPTLCMVDLPPDDYGSADA